MNKDIYRSISACRICQSEKLTLVLDLGSQPPANSLRLERKELLPSIPLRIGLCENCKTVQLLETVDPQFLFENYVWVTGTSKIAQEHAHVFYDAVVEWSESVLPSVVEIASNDGTFLRKFIDKGHKVLGVDPAKNIAHMAKKNGVPTLAEYFGLEVAEEIRKNNGAADCVIARNVIPHVADIHGVIGGMASLVKDDGCVVIEFHHSLIILDELHYDSIYHEHLFYFSINSLSYLLKQHGLFINDVLDSPISGGSKILCCRKYECEKSKRLLSAIELESEASLNSYDSWERFARKAQDHRADLNEIVTRLIDDGKSLVGYGASARCSTLLNFCGLNDNVLSCIFDKSPLKHGRFTAGTNIPIKLPGELPEVNPDVVLLAAWNFEKEIIQELRNDLGFQGPIIVPLPGEPRVLGG
jgi:SAM-dependent methyltransferase